MGSDVADFLGSDISRAIGIKKEAPGTKKASIGFTAEDVARNKRKKREKERKRINSEVSDRRSQLDEADSSEIDRITRREITSILDNRANPRSRIPTALHRRLNPLEQEDLDRVDALLTGAREGTERKFVSRRAIEERFNILRTQPGQSQVRRANRAQFFPGTGVLNRG